REELRSAETHARRIGSAMSVVDRVPGNERLLGIDTEPFLHVRALGEGDGGSREHDEALGAARQRRIELHVADRPFGLRQDPPHVDPQYDRDLLREHDRSECLDDGSFTDVEESMQVRIVIADGPAQVEADRDTGSELLTAHEVYPEPFSDR